MTTFLTFVLGCIASLIANYLSPPIRRASESALSFVFHLFNKDRFDLTGKWNQTFSEPEPGNVTKWNEINEVAKLRHLGSRVTGRGETQTPHRIFRYDLIVQHNLVFGAYEKVGEKGNITGKGVIQLIVSPDRLQMEGQETWFDHDTNQIESSKCIWKKN